MNRKSAILAVMLSVGVSGLATACSGNGPTSSAGPSAKSGVASSPAPGGSAGSSPSPAPTGSTRPPAPSAPTRPAGSQGSAGGSGSTASAARADGSCRNLPVPADVKTAVTQTWAVDRTATHLVPRPGSFYYGKCGDMLYASTYFTAGPGTTDNERVQLQDDGSVRQYFRFTPGTGWSFVTADPFPDTAKGCAAAIPASLAARWGNCPHA